MTVCQNRTNQSECCWRCGCPVSRFYMQGELLQIDKELRGVALPQMTLAETDAARRTNTAV